jgi:hypothetical protein
VCAQYIHGVRHDLEAVVDIMDEMRWYFKHTCYKPPRRPSYYSYWSDEEDEDDNDFWDPVEASREEKIRALHALKYVKADDGIIPVNVRRLAEEMGVPIMASC